jgi:tRNA(Ile)-lysidine synthase
MSNRPQVFCAERLLGVLRSLPAVNSYFVGFSGGADSTALLHALGCLRDQLNTPITAVHVNHGLHDNAVFWQLQCEDFCRSNDFELICLKVNPENGPGKKGLEAEARQLRYEAISRLLGPGDGLLTAHHADDQAETLLLNLMRGSGVDGLSAMPDSRPLGKGLLQRPLLQFQSSALRDYLEKNQVEWSEDPSNQYLNHDRNFVRHQIIPFMEKRWPGVNKRLLLTRRSMSDARRLLERLADQHLENCLANPSVLSIPPLLIDDPELLKLVIRRWVKKTGTPSIPAYRLEDFCEQLRNAQTSSNVTVHWDGCLLHLYKQQLWLISDTPVTSCPSINWPDANTGIDLGRDIGQLQFTPTDNGKELKPLDVKLTVGCRKNTRNTAIVQAGHHRSLKNLFQSMEIPPWLRDAIPLCSLDDEVVAIGDWCFSESFERWMSENNTALNWQPGHPLLEYIQMQAKAGKAVKDRS